MIKRNVLVLLIAAACLGTLTSCATLTSIIGTDVPRATAAEVARPLCVRADDGTFIYGPIALSRQDVLTEETLRLITAHAAAWEAATENGKLCGALGAENFGKIKWGTD